MAMKFVLLVLFVTGSVIFGASKPVSSASKNKKSEILKLNQSTPSSSFRLVEKILLPLGEEIITLSEQNQLERELRANLVPPNLLLEIFPKKTLLSDKEALFNFLIAQKVIDLSLKEEHAVAPEEKQIEDQLSRLKASLSSTAFIRKLHKHSLNIRKMKAKTLQFMKRDFFLTTEFAAKIVVSDSDINGYFFNTKGKSLFHVFEYEFSFLSFPQSKEGLKKARKTFQAVPVSSFEDLSKQAGVRFEKHRLKSYEMSPAMEKALKNLSVSQTSPLTPIGNQVYIFRLNWKAPVFTPDQERERRRIHSLLLKKEMIREFHKWLKEEKSRYSLSYL